MSLRPSEPLNLLGVEVDPIEWKDLLQSVEHFLEGAEPRTIAYANIHVLNSAVGDPTLRAFLNMADLCYCDGEGVRLGARLLGRRFP